ncbi:MAG: hypothetical protein KDA27_10325 [Candidatus Eisenbacteria bacterium]|uniref:Uncharacterized protein n=1 Tax=Eiseniibacteriota bacterium TaxID=2212470 RepID=A0A956NBM8_UNCEI|nr:hypothetical protein [Candidatus Eisenbacteria bacterium]MCB9462810.1 hypothetical protein [Candidatus Eisenbacteria bacterium]
MSVDRNLYEQLETFSEKSRYPVAAYVWILRVIDETRRRLGRDGHINASELLEGHRTLALQEFGPAAFDVFRHWGFEGPADVGRAVYELVEGGFLGKTDEDSVDDFASGYDFRKAFVEEYPW